MRIECEVSYLIPLVKAYSTREGMEVRDSVLWEPDWKGYNLGKGSMGGSFLKGYTFSLRIECSTTTLSTTLMRKWPLNSDFTTSNPFYYLQQNFDKTSILRKILRHTNGGLGSKEGGYIKGRKPSSKRGDDYGRIRETRKWIVYCLV